MPEIRKNKEKKEMIKYTIENIKKTKLDIDDDFFENDEKIYKYYSKTLSKYLEKDKEDQNDKPENT